MAHTAKLYFRSIAVNRINTDIYEHLLFFARVKSGNRIKFLKGNWSYKKVKITSLITKKEKIAVSTKVDVVEAVLMLIITCFHFWYESNYLFSKCNRPSHVKVQFLDSVLQIFQKAPNISWYVYEIQYFQRKDYNSVRIFVWVCVCVYICVCVHLHLILLEGRKCDKKVWAISAIMGIIRAEVIKYL